MVRNTPQEVCTIKEEEGCILNFTLSSSIKPYKNMCNWLKKADCFHHQWFTGSLTAHDLVIQITETFLLAPIIKLHFCCCTMFCRLKKVNNHMNSSQLFNVNPILLCCWVKNTFGTWDEGIIPLPGNLWLGLGSCASDNDGLDRQSYAMKSAETDSKAAVTCILAACCGHFAVHIKSVLQQTTP